MSRIIRVVTTSLGVYNYDPPPRNLRESEPSANLEGALALLDAAGHQGADLVCLPEGFIAAGIATSRLPDLAEPIPGPAFDAVASYAQRYGMYVVAGFYTQEDAHLRNVAAVIGRDGKLVGQYAKQHPTEGEIQFGVIPGTTPGVFETEIGRIGVAVCFDVNWREVWESLARQRAELVCWLSGYEGGFPLRAYAAIHHIPVVTSVWPFDARIIDMTGRVIAATSQWNPIAVTDLDLNMRLFHTDYQADKLLLLQQKYGNRVRVEAYTEEHIFTLATVDPDLRLDDVITEFELVEYDQYIERCSRAQELAEVALVAAPSPA
jgi:predicted amidohydrolase